MPYAPTPLQTTKGAGFPAPHRFCLVSHASRLDLRRGCRFERVVQIVQHPVLQFVVPVLAVLRVQGFTGRILLAEPIARFVVVHAQDRLAAEHLLHMFERFVLQPAHRQVDAGGICQAQ